ncbi:MAG: PHP domain-containing protein [Armatimonadetes bacterium]|nr:PHP domain-containing protein [Armatimonadota bacterium]
MKHKMAIDLHIHSTFSDGTLTPQQIVQVALDKQLTAVAISDHDTVSGVVPAQQAAAETELQVLPAVEISTTVDGRDVHILGYFIDLQHAGLREKLQAIRDARQQRARQIADKLEKLGIVIDFEKLLEEAGPDSIGRPHIARRLVREGYVPDARQAFARYLRRGGSAYVERYRLTPEEAVELVITAGGLPVLAHPALDGAEQHVDSLIDCGLQGLEAYHIIHSPAQTRRYIARAQEKGLLITGGSDSHGPEGPIPVEIGAVEVPDEYAEHLLDWANQHRAANAKVGEADGNSSD